MDSQRDRSPSWLYGVLIFLSAFLLFQIQPILAKLILPWFGGAAAIWVMALAFYQSVYLGGNLYAHVLIRHSGPRTAALIHTLALLASLAFLPVIPTAVWQPAGNEDPAWRILALLALTVGLPFLLLSATSPLVQSWYVRQARGPRPYRLYALSNAGSLLALLSYPILIEPIISTHHQAIVWSGAYVVFVLLGGWLAFRQPAAAETPAAEPPKNARPGWGAQLLWLALAAGASALLVSITHYVSQNIAAVPLLWIVPLLLYLLTLILCFEGRRWYRRSFFLPALPVVLAGMIYALSPKFENSASPQAQIALFFAGLLICCMACHGELADLKPQPEFLSLFYLLLSAGGALGGIFAGVVAPRLFRGFYELPLALGLCALAVFAALLYGASQRRSRLPRPALWAATAIAALLLLFLAQAIQLQSRGAELTVRNFYGVLRVNIVPAGGARPAVTQLRHGTIVHGEEIIDPARNDVPTTYYGEHSGAGITLLLESQRGNLQVGVIGLGIGTLARYGQPGDQYSFYEINPLVTDLAGKLFDFLAQSEAQVKIIPGDARLSLERETAQQFDVLVADAFSGDAIPVHLLTREAFALYFRRLKPHGVLAIHVSNRFLDLPPVIRAGAQAVGARAIKVTSAEDDASAVYEATWMLLDRSDSPSRTVSALIDRTVLLPAGTSSEIERGSVRAWTDDYSNLIEILK